MKLLALLLLIFANLRAASTVIWPTLRHNFTLETETIASEACEIVNRYTAQITYIYHCATCLSTRDPYQIELELQLHKCIAARNTICTRTLEAHELEPRRHTDSMNLLVLPAGTHGLALMQRFVSMLNARQRKKHMHKYIFIWPEANEPLMKQLFRGVWTKGYLFAIAITAMHTSFGYEPFRANGPQVVPIGADKRYFYDKLKNLQGYTLRFSMFIDPLRAVPRKDTAVNGFDAIDGEVARTVAAHMNASATYVLPADNENYGVCLRNGKFTGAVKDIIGHKTHVAFNVRFVLDCMASQLEQLYPYSRRTIYLVVPAAEMRPEFLIFVNTFKRSVWHLVTVNFLIVSLVFYALQRFAERIPGAARFRHIHWYEIFEMFMKTQLGEPVSGFSRISSLRQFLMAWILFSYVLTTIYFAKLESLFIQPCYEPELDSLSELSRLDGVPVYAIHSLFFAARATLAPEHFDKLRKNAILMPLNYSSYDYALPIAKKSKRVAFVMRAETAKDFLANTYNAETERPQFHMVHEYLRSMPNTYIMPEGTPFLYKFQALVSAFHEYGLMEHWQSMDVLRRKRQSTRAEEFYENLGDDVEIEQTDANELKETKHRKHVALSLDILQGGFYLWGFGILLSLAGFIAEYAHWSCKNWRKNPLN